MSTLHPIGHLLSATLIVGTLKGPHIDWAALAPLLALLAGAVVVLTAGLLGSNRLQIKLAPALTLASLGAALGLTVWQWNAEKSVVAGALRVDDLTLVLNLVLITGAACAVLLALRSHAARGSSPSELYALLLTSVGGMSLLASAQNTVILFLGFELLSIPLYVLCAMERDSERSLEAGLKYLIIGSVGGATLVYGLALVYGITGATEFEAIAQAISSRGLSGDTMLLGGVALCVAGLCFKASVAPFHQWTPDVYEGAPTPITAFMAVATKVAALGAFLRFFDVALIDLQPTWGPAVAVLATITILVGNVGAIGQTSLKRMLGWSAVAQAGYMLTGVVVSTELGIRATVFYLAAYMFMNLAAFAVVIARERSAGLGDSIDAVTGLGREDPWLAWPMTISMLGLAGIPATVGFIGKFYLIDAAVSGDYTWLGVMIVVGSMLSLAYYLSVVAAIWMREAPSGAPQPASPGPRLPGGLPAIAGGSSELDAARGGDDGADEAPAAEPAPGAAATRAGGVLRTQPEVALVALLAAGATIFFGIIPGPLFDLVHGAGSGFGLF
jgi:NADH-quinone oxidoreductase subunit N